MRFQVSVIFALFSAPFVACKTEEPLHDASNSLVRTTYEDSAPVIETNDPDTMEQAWFHRELQFTDACNASLEELYSDEALNAASMAYAEAVDAAFANFGNTSSLESCEQTSETVVTCDFSPPIDGEEEYMSACTAAGGEILSLSSDVTCTGNVNETAGTLIIDLPATMKCIPSSPDFASCADTIREAFQNLTEFSAIFYEGILPLFGIKDATCAAADAGGDTGGSDNGAGGDSGGSDNGGGDSDGSGTDESEDGGSSGGGGSGSDSGESNASTLSLLISFGVMAFISLTLG